MIEEEFLDAERQLLIVLATQALVGIRDDPEMKDAITELSNILAKLSGRTTIISRRQG